MGERLVVATAGTTIGELDGRFPFGRVARPEDVAGVVAFLAGQDADHLTGQRISVDGGGAPIGTRNRCDGCSIPAPTGSHEQRMAALRKIREAANGTTGVEASQRKWAAIQENAQRSIAPALPPQGRYPDPDRDHLLRWWDGTGWSGRTAPRIG